MPSPHAAEIVLTNAERAELGGQRADATARQCGRSCVTARIILAAADGGTNVELAGRLELDRGDSQVEQQVSRRPLRRAVE